MATKTKKVGRAKPAKTQFPPTAEQQNCIDMAVSGNNLVIRAYAGCGKTTTLTHMANAIDNSQIYLAFNKAIVADAEKVFPDHCKPMTLHGMAFRETRDTYLNSSPKGADKMVGNINAGFVKWKMNISGQRELAPGVIITPRGFAHLMVETVKRWMRSGATKFGNWCVPLDGALRHVPEQLLEDCYKQVLPMAERLWIRMSDPSDELPLTHDGYLKVFSLTNPQLPCDTLYVDEAQDLNGIVLDLVRKQDCQVVLVGDGHQQIYAWRGAQDALDKLGIENEARLSQSFRFSEELAANATEILELLGETVPLRGNPAKSGGVGFIESPATVLSRTNAGVLDQCLRQLKNGRIPGIVGGAKEVIKTIEAIQMLKADQPTEHPDFFGFSSWREVQDLSDKPEGQEFRRWVKLDEEHDLEHLADVLDGLPTEKKADVLVSTGHKAKGREWDTVKVAGDFLLGVKSVKEQDKERQAWVDGQKQDVGGMPPASPEEKKAELRLLYVACTRAMGNLDMHPELFDKLDTLRQPPAA